MDGLTLALYAVLFLAVLANYVLYEFTREDEDVADHTPQG